MFNTSNIKFFLLFFHLEWVLSTKANFCECSGRGGHFWALRAHSTHEMSCNSGKHQVRSAPSAAHDRFKDAENETHIF